MSTSTAVCDPVGSPAQYSPSLKVEHCLFENLWTSAQQTEKVGLDCWIICAQLDLLCKKELLQHEKRKVENGNTTIGFESKALIYLNKLQSIYKELPAPKCTLVQYLEQQGISKLYPRAYIFVKNPSDFTMELQSTHMDLYNQQLSVINQVICLSKQLHNDLRTASNHKYIAHQLAVLYQCLKPLSGVPRLSALKSNIEENFNNVKESLCMCSEESSYTKLQEDYMKWLLQLTEEVSHILKQYPEQISSAIQGPARAASRII